MQASGPFRALLFTAAMACASTQAFAITNSTPQRAYVSALSGSDTNNCGQDAPCRTIQAALAQVIAGGEVLVLDSGGFGTFGQPQLINITQSVTITAPSGIYAGISPSLNTDGVLINAPGAVVVIRGLSINSQSSAIGTSGGNGINILAAAKVSIENCVINGMTNAGISVNAASTTTAVDLVVENSQFHNNSRGIHLGGAIFGAPYVDSSATPVVHASIHNVLIDADDLTGTNPHAGAIYGIDAGANVHVVVDASQILGQSIGIFVLNPGTLTPHVIITGTRISGSTQAGIHFEFATSMLAVMRANVIIDSAGTGVVINSSYSPIRNPSALFCLEGNLISGNVIGLSVFTVDPGFSAVRVMGANVIDGNSRNLLSAFPLTPISTL